MKLQKPIISSFCILKLKKSTFLPTNPNGCWDWWGYTGSLMDTTTYVSKEGKQMNAIWEMVQDLTSGSKIEEIDIDF